MERLGRMAAALRGVAVGEKVASPNDLAEMFALGYTPEANISTADADWFFGGYSVILSSWLETVLPAILEDAGAAAEDTKERNSTATWFGQKSNAFRARLVAILDAALRPLGLRVRDTKKTGESQNWHDQVKGAFRELSGVGLDEMSHYDDILRIRRLANCFKHNNFTADRNMAKAREYEEGERICYLLEDWDGLLKALREFLQDVIIKLAREPAAGPRTWG